MEIETILIAAIVALGGLGVGYWIIREFLYPDRKIAVRIKECNCTTRPKPQVIPQVVIQQITRQEIVEEFRRIKDTSLEIVDRFDNPRLPSSLKHKGKTFASMFGTDMGIILVAKLPQDVADVLAKNHRDFGPSSFPKGKNWYALPIGSSFKNKADVIDVLLASYEFIKNPPAKVKSPKKPKTKKKVKK